MKSLPIMPALCSKHAYYVSAIQLILHALASLLCLKLCHNWHGPTVCCVCVCVCVRVCVCAYARACVHVCVLMYYVVLTYA